MAAIYRFRRPDGEVEDVSSSSYLQAVAGVPPNSEYLGAGGPRAGAKVIVAGWKVLVVGLVGLIATCVGISEFSRWEARREEIAYRPVNACALVKARASAAEWRMDDGRYQKWCDDLYGNRMIQMPHQFTDEDLWFASLDQAIGRGDAPKWPST